MKTLRMITGLGGVAIAATLLTSAPAMAQKTLLVLGDGVPASLDTDGPAGTHLPSQTGMYNMIEPLIDYPVPGSPNDVTRLPDFKSFAPRLATSWSFDPATNSWTLKLRHGVKSCAGNTFTADDVLYTFARAKSLSGRAPIGYFLASVASLSSFTPALFAKTPEAIAARKLGPEVEKIDDYTVRFHLSAPNNLFLSVLPIFGLLIYDRAEMLKHATASDPWSHNYTNTTDAPSFGPWCLQSWKKDESFTVRRNPAYYGDKPYFERVVYRRVPQSANRIAILRAGQAGVVEGLSPAELNSLKTAPNVSIAGGYLNASLIMLANFKTKPFDNPLVRKALAYAIPYGEIIKNSYYGDAKQWHGLIPSSYPGYHQPTAEYHYDPAMAKKLLAQAGYPDGKGLEAFPAAFKLAYPADREAILGPTATLIRTRLRAVGFPVELDPMPATDYANRQLVKKDLPFGLSDQSKPIAVDTIYSMQLSFVTVPRGVNNQTNFSDPTFDKLFDEARVEQNPSTRQQELDQAQDILADKLPWIPILETKLLYATNSKIKGLVLEPHQDLVWRYLHE